MAETDTPPPATELSAVSATETKNSLGAVLERALVEGGIAIKKRNEVKAVLLSVQQYEALRSARPDPLADLAGEFDTLVERMQQRAARAAGRALFDASPAQLGGAAAAGRLRSG